MTMIPVAAEESPTCHVARVIDKASFVADNTSEPSCGALGALVPWAGQESSGLSRGPYCCSEEVAKADGERNNPQDDSSCGAGVGSLCYVLQEDGKTRVDEDVCAWSTECRDAGVSDEYPSTVCGSTGISGDCREDKDTRPWYWFLRSRVRGGTPFAVFESLTVMTAVGPHCARPGTWALCGYWGCSRRVPFHGPGPPTTACVLELGLTCWN